MLKSPRDLAACPEADADQQHARLTRRDRGVRDLRAIELMHRPADRHVLDREGAQPAPAPSVEHLHRMQRRRAAGRVGHQELVHHVVTAVAPEHRHDRLLRHERRDHGSDHIARRRPRHPGRRACRRLGEPGYHNDARNDARNQRHQSRHRAQPRVHLSQAPFPNHLPAKHPCADLPTIKHRGPDRVAAAHPARRTVPTLRTMRL